MTLVEALAILASREIRIITDGDTIRLSGRAPAPAEALATLRRHRRELLAMLAAAPRCGECHGAILGETPAAGGDGGTYHRRCLPRLATRCACCGGEITGPPSAWWGGRPVHAECGRLAWAEAWLSVPPAHRAASGEA